MITVFTKWYLAGWTCCHAQWYNHNDGFCTVALSYAKRSNLRKNTHNLTIKHATFLLQRNVKRQIAYHSVIKCGIMVKIQKIEWI